MKTNIQDETENKVVLNEKLQKALNEVGNTPIDEPEIAKALDAKPLKKGSVVKTVLKRLDLKMKDFKPLEIAEFFHAITLKVNSVRDEDGSFKKTPATAECDLPDFEEAEEIQNLWMALIESNDEDRDVKGKELDEIVWKVSGLKKEKLTDWESNLVIQQILQSGYDITMTSLGKELKNL